MSYFRQTISLNIDRTEMYYWTNIDKSSEISVKLANELAIAFRKKRNYDKAYLFYKELLQKAPNNVAYLESCAEMQVCRGQEKDALRMYETILQLDADNLAANIFLGNYYYLMAEQEKKKLETDYKKFFAEGCFKVSFYGGAKDVGQDSYNRKRGEALSGSPLFLL